MDDGLTFRFVFTDESPAVGASAPNAAPPEARAGEAAKLKPSPSTVESPPQPRRPADAHGAPERAPSPRPGESAPQPTTKEQPGDRTPERPRRRPVYRDDGEVARRQPRRVAEPREQERKSGEAAKLLADLIRHLQQLPGIGRAIASLYHIAEPLVAAGKQIRQMRAEEAKRQERTQGIEPVRREPPKPQPVVVPAAPAAEQALPLPAVTTPSGEAPEPEKPEPWNADAFRAEWRAATQAAEQAEAAPRTPATTATAPASQPAPVIFTPPEPREFEFSEKPPTILAERPAISQPALSPAPPRSKAPEPQPRPIESNRRPDSAESPAAPLDTDALDTLIARLERAEQRRDSLMATAPPEPRAVRHVEPPTKPAPPPPALRNLEPRDSLMAVNVLPAPVEISLPDPAPREIERPQSPPPSLIEHEPPEAGAAQQAAEGFRVAGKPDQQAALEKLITALGPLSESTRELKATLEPLTTLGYTMTELLAAVKEMERTREERAPGVEGARPGEAAEEKRPFGASAEDDAALERWEKWEKEHGPEKPHHDDSYWSHPNATATAPPAPRPVDANATPPTLGAASSAEPIEAEVVESGAAAASAGAGGAAVAGGAALGPAGLVAGIAVVAAVGTATRAIGALAHAAVAADRALQDTAKELSMYSSSLAAAQANASVRKIMNDVERAQFAGKDFAAFTNERAELSRSMDRIVTAVEAAMLKEIVPILRAINTLISPIAENMELLEAIINAAIAAGANLMFPGLAAIAQAILQGVKQQKTQQFQLDAAADIMGIFGGHPVAFDPKGALKNMGGIQQPLTPKPIVPGPGVPPGQGIGGI